MHTVSSEVWLALQKNIHDQYRNNRAGMCDPRMRTLVSTMLFLPGVLPVFSCSGHAPEERRDHPVRIMTAHLAFVMKDETGYKVLQKISEWIMGMDTKNHFMLAPRLEMSKRILHDPALGVPADFYPVWCIHMNIGLTDENFQLAEEYFDDLAVRLTED